MALTKVINDLADLNQSGSTNALKGCVGTTAQQPASSTSIDYLIVGGGGGAGGGIANSWGGGGGGAGGYLTGSTTVYHGTPTVLTVGEGGNGNNVRTASGFNGDDSGFNGIRAIGGGGGGAESIDAVDGASGGGAGGNLSGTASQPGSSVSGQGNAGGGVASPVNGSASGGGGGGAVGSIPSTSSVGGAGGIGVDQTSFISVVNANLAQIGDTSNAAQEMFSGGGGGASDYQASGTGGAGGLGGGGNGGTDGTNNGNGISGTTNTGGGGGGGNATPAIQALGGTGGSGVAVLKYDNTIVTGYTLNSEDTYTVNWPADKYGVSYWPLNLDVKDVGGNYDGTATDITYTNGKFNQAASFNGSSSYIERANFGSIVNTSNAFSYSFWVYFNSIGTYDWVIGIQQAGSPYAGVGLFGGSSNNLGIALGGAGPAVMTGTLSLSTWMHIAFTHDGSGTYKCYVDGGTPITYSGVTSSNSANPLRLGLSSVSGWDYFDGILEQVRIYTSELSLTDVQDIYNNSKPGSLPPLKTSSDLTTHICNFPTGVTGTSLYEFKGVKTDTCGNYVLTDGTYAPTYGVGKFSSQCALFDGDSASTWPNNPQGFIQADGFGAATNNLSSLSVSMWINVESINVSPNTTQFLLVAYDYLSASSKGWLFKILSTGALQCDAYYNNSTNLTLTSHTILSINKWYHIGLTLSQTEGNIYINGRLDNTGALSGGGLGFNYHTGQQVTIGNGIIAGVPETGYNGRIDQFRFYSNNILTATNIYDLWQKENSIQTYFPDTPTSGTDTLVFKEGSGEITFKNDTPPGAEVGMLRYNSTLNKMEHFNSGGWKDFSYCTTDLCDYPTQADSVLLYRFNDNVTDTCGTYNGTAGGSLSYTTGKFGKAIDTTSGYVDTGYIFPTDSTMSVSFWMNLTTAPGATDVYMLSDMDSGAGNLRLALRIAGAYSNKLYIDISDGSSSDAKDTGWIPAYNTWYHIAITFNGTAVVLYVDGVSTLSYTSTVSFGTAGAQQQVIGRPGAYTSCCYFPGLIDQFRLFTSTLTANEVLDLYNEVQC